MRIGRYVPNASRALRPLVERGSLLIMSRAGVGKTTLLRDLAASIAQHPGRPLIMVVDTSNEIGGDGPVPMPFLGRCRRIQVPRRSDQSRVMIEAIQNHSPQYLVVDELATAEEAEAAWSIAQRGVRLIATCHGENLAALLQNQALNLLVGGAAQAFLSNEERRLRNKVKKTVLERPHSSPFDFVVELCARNNGYLYFDVNKAVDLILDDQPAKPNAAVGGEVTLSELLPRRIERRLRMRERTARLSESQPDEDLDEVPEDQPFSREYVDDDGYLVTEASDQHEGHRGDSTLDVLERRRDRLHGKSHYGKHGKKNEVLREELSRLF
ncbi:unnamed protein product [Phytomonas sp. EM1]|nr:unnamed protein product [Phytomonas sp. EM1]|eukprot:CCW61619.1 unnamed protein product [Phytomonas sp. isolate EM1]